MNASRSAHPISAIGIAVGVGVGVAVGVAIATGAALACSVVAGTDAAGGFTG